MLNTHLDTLYLIHNLGGATAAEIVARFYPNSRQPGKKATTTYRHLRRMTRLGWVRPMTRVGDRSTRYTAERYVITQAGRAAGLARQRATVTEPDFPRLAK